MQKHLKILMTGALVIVPLAATIFLIVYVGKMLGNFGQYLLSAVHLTDKVNPEWQGLASWLGVLAVIAFIYMLGLLANSIMFGKLFNFIDQMLSSLPGIKTVYESTRDLMKLFGQSDRKKGRAVLYKPAGDSMCMLGILTNEDPVTQPGGEKRLVVFLPMAYMIGGPVVLARPEEITPLDIPVERALKLAITAHIASDSLENKHRKKEKDKDKD